MRTPYGDRFVWRKSTYSTGQGGQCVEVGAAAEVVGVRDTKDRDGGQLTVSSRAWRAFVDGVARG